MAPIADIVAALSADATIAGVAGTRIYDRDVRRVGWESLIDEAFDEDGDLLPLLMVDDAGASRSAFGSPIEAGLVYVWAYAARTDSGRAAIATLMERVLAVMDGLQLGSPGPMVRWAGRLGQQDDDDAVFDRTTLQVAGVLATQRW